MANKAVSLYLSVRINGKWTFRKAPAQRLRKLSEGSYYLSWYEGPKKKGKKGKKSAKDRFIPIPADLMAQLKNHCEGKGLRDLVFTNSQGNPQGHFLRMCEQIAARAGFDGSEWELHRWRKTFATMQHEKNGVSVNTLRVWLGHESLDVTRAYLKGSDAAEEHVREQVNNGALAEFV